MLLSDRVRLELYEETGETDSHGNPIASWVDYGTVPAEVHPLAGEVTFDASREKVVSRYRVTLTTRVEIPSRVGADLRLTWSDFGPTTGRYLEPDGAVERHTVMGRLHHYELTTKSVLG